MALSSKLGHFNLLEEIAHGGMGTVFRAFDPTLNREVAIKVLREELASDPKFLADFVREARVVAGISHPHIVQIYFVGEEAGQHYIVMELLKGRTLREMVEADGPTDEERALDITIDVAEALRAAYKSQMIHGDIKPANIFITEDFGGKVLDFGLAKLANIEADTSGGIWGSPYYMSPERVGQKAEDFRSDIYSLGATLFDVLTGRPPFDAEDLQQLALKRLQEKPPLLREINPEITQRTEDVVNKMLSKSPLMRYRDYDHLLEDLRDAKTEATAKRLGVQLHVQPGPPEPEVAPVPEKRSSSPLILIALAVMVGVIGVLALLLWRSRGSHPSHPSARTNGTFRVGPTPEEIARSNAAVAAAAAAQSNAEAKAREIELQEKERQLVLAADRDVSDDWRDYDFSTILSNYTALDSQIQTATNHALLKQRLKLVRLMTDFKTQLINDIARLPYDRGDLQTGRGSRLLGRLSMATDSQLTFSTAYGPFTVNWTDLAPPSLVQIARFYAEAFAQSEVAAVQGHRYFTMAAFCKEYKLTDSASRAARKAVEVAPDMRPDVLALFDGRMPPPPRPEPRPPATRNPPTPGR